MNCIPEWHEGDIKNSIYEVSCPVGVSVRSHDCVVGTVVAIWISAIHRIVTDILVQVQTLWIIEIRVWNRFFLRAPVVLMNRPMLLA